MKLLYPSAKGFAKAMEIVWNIIDEGTLEVDKDGIGLIAMDPSQVSMIAFSISKDMFSEYEVEKKEQLGLDINYIKNILKRARAEEKLGLELEGPLLNISFIGKRSRRSFKVRLLEPSQGGFNREPNLEYLNNIRIDAGALKDIIKDASIVANYIRFEMSPDGFAAIAKGDYGEVKEEFEKGEDLLEINVEEKDTALYSVKYLDDILKSVGKGDIVRLYMNTNMPLKMEMTVEGAKLRYYLAPASEGSE